MIITSESETGKFRLIRALDYCSKSKVFAFLILLIQGFICEEHENPADFFLDVINRCERVNQNKEAVLFVPGEEESGELVSADVTNNAMQLADSYHKSPEYQNLRVTIDPVLQNMRDEEQKEGITECVAKRLLGQESYATNLFWQVKGYIIHSEE